MRTVIAFLLVLSLCLPVEAQQWPTRPVRVIVNVAPGGVPT